MKWGKFFYWEKRYFELWLCVVVKNETKYKMLDWMNDQCFWFLRFWTISMISMMVSHPLIFHPWFLAIWQMHGQQSFSAERAHFIQFKSACWSCPFSLAAWSQYWKAKLSSVNTFLSFSFTLVQQSCWADALWERDGEDESKDKDVFHHLSGGNLIIIRNKSTNQFNITLIKLHVVSIWL